MTPEELRQRREALRMSRTRLSKYVHLSPRTIKAYESGSRKIPPGTADALKALLRTAEEGSDLEITEVYTLILEANVGEYLDLEGTAQTSLDGLHEVAQVIAARTSRPVHVVRWSNREDVEVVYP